MALNTNRMIHFTRLIKINGRIREFNFKKNNIAGSNVFDVDTVDDRGNRIFFRLVKKETEWDLSSSTKIPDWISENITTIFSELEQGITQQP